MSYDDSASQYFRKVYPVLRGATNRNWATRLTRRLTEPGQQQRVEWVLGEVGAERPLRILDVGCGQGAYVVALARLGHYVTGLDLSAAMLCEAGRAAHGAGVSDRVQLLEADLRTWCPPEAYDVVLCMGIVEYYAHPVGMLRRILGWSKACLLISVSKVGPRPRTFLRWGWLRLHGVRVNPLRPTDLGIALSRLPGVAATIRETEWTYCLACRREDSKPSTTGTSPAMADAVAASGGAAWDES